MDMPELRHEEPGVFNKVQRLRAMKQKFVPLPVEELVEYVVDINESGTYPILEAHSFEGFRVKLVINVPEEWVENIDPAGIAKQFRLAGASHVKTPEVRVIRKDVVRDERHHVDVPLEESLRLFADETKIQDAERRIAFAAKVAREADDR